MISMVEIKDRISQALKERRKTPKQLSDLTGIPISSISQYMSGHVKPKQDRIYLICKALRINEAWLIGYEDVPMDKEIAVLRKEMNNITDDEMKVIENYRLLSEKGKTAVQYIFDQEEKIRKYENKLKALVDDE